MERDEFPDRDELQCAEKRGLAVEENPADQPARVERSRLAGAPRLGLAAAGAPRLGLAAREPRHYSGSHSVLTFGVGCMP